MKKPNITPGPWNLGDQDPLLVDTETWYLATVCDNVGEGSSRANARAIAAIPDLLEALEEMLKEAKAADIDTMPGDDFAGFLIACENARAALTKAGYTP